MRCQLRVLGTNPGPLQEQQALFKSMSLIEIELFHFSPLSSLHALPGTLHPTPPMSPYSGFISLLLLGTQCTNTRIQTCL